MLEVGWTLFLMQRDCFSLMHAKTGCMGYPEHLCFGLSGTDPCSLTAANVGHQELA